MTRKLLVVFALLAVVAVVAAQSATADPGSYRGRYQLRLDPATTLVSPTKP